MAHDDDLIVEDDAEADNLAEASGEEEIDEDGDASILKDEKESELESEFSSALRGTDPGVEFDNNQEWQTALREETNDGEDEENLGLGMHIEDPTRQAILDEDEEDQV
jgi:hypothetical protein